MSATPSPPPTPRKPWSGPTRRALLPIAAAFAAGLLLFVLLWLDRRDDGQFFRAGGSAAPDARGRAFEPLPVPDAAGYADADDAGDAGAVGPESARERSAAEARTGDGAPGEPLPPATPLPPPASPAEPAASAAPDASARPIESPPPRYPARALRRGESGTVLLQVHVDAQGRPTRVDVVQSSRSRELDREAQRTVERWRFSPATRSGRAEPSRVLIPIEFHP